ncbi:UNVERIFIED_CONTAM: HNH endonuclease, partial [Lacticaseibacillus paracasei]|nr:HNH endonuclease [Lacticaseibacillus paracasei]
KDYLLARDNYRDALDGKQYPASQLRVHHLVQRKDGGSNQPDNLVLLSDINHNQANHNNGILAKLRENRQKTLDYRGAYFMSILATRLSNYFEHYTTTQGYLTANLRQKLRNNNRVLQKFYDAKYIDSRDGKQKAGKELSSGRTRRSQELNYD